MALQKCEYCNQRYRFEKLHHRECFKRRNILKRSNALAVQNIRTEQENEQGIQEVTKEEVFSAPIVEMTPVSIEQKPKRKYQKKEKQ